MTLYEINQEIEKLIDPETGELLDYEAFEALDVERTEKLENTLLWVKDLIAEAEAIKAEIEKLTERKKAAENKQARLLEFVKIALDGEQFKTPKCEVKYRKSESVEIENEAAFTEWALNGHDEMLTYKAPTISKTAVKEALKHGTEIPGASLVQKVNMRVI